MERETESSETAFNGRKVPMPPDANKDKTTVVIHKDGSLVSYKSSNPEKDSDKIRAFVNAHVK